VNFNDIDLCLKIHAAGYHNLWTPYALLYHHESASRGQDITDAKATRATHEMQYMKQRWNGMLLADPAYNPNLSLDKLNYDLAFPPRSGKL
jgi:GT2 family glycosyltransferase